MWPKEGGRRGGRASLISDQQRQKFVIESLKTVSSVYGKIASRSLSLDPKCNGQFLHLGPKDLPYITEVWQ